MPAMLDCWKCGLNDCSVGMLEGFGFGTVTGMLDGAHTDNPSLMTCETSR